MISASFRQRFRATIEAPVARAFKRTGLSPNALTLIGFAIAVVGAGLAAAQSWLLAGLIVAFGAVFDLFDGALARATGKTSKFGAFLDSTMDRAGEAVVYIGIALGLMAAYRISPAGALNLTTQADTNLGVLAALAALAASFMVSYTRAKSESLGFSSGTGMGNVGLAPREVRTIILTLGLIAAGLAPAPGALDITWWYVLVGALGLIAILATVTAIQRIYFVYRQPQSTTQEAQK